MTDLVVCLGTDQKVWDYLRRLVEGEPWGSVFVVSPDANPGFSCSRPVRFVAVDVRSTLPELVEQVRRALDGKILDTEAAVNVVLGSGKEHMAVMSALLRLGVGIRLVAYTSEGVKEI